MADFELIEKHPWWTAAIIGVGALLVYLFFRSRSNAAASAAGYQGGYQTVDPTLAAAQLAASTQQANLQVQANAQTNQLNAQLAAVNIQSNAQIQLATLSAAVQSQNITATQDVTNQQTAGQVAVALGSQQATVDQARINAGVQISYIDALVAAFGGNRSTPTPTPSPTPVTYPTPGTSTPVTIANPVTQSTQQINTYSPPYPSTPTPTTPGGSGTPYQTPSGWWSNAGVPDRASYGLDPNGGGFHCSPRDSPCVQQQNDASIAYFQAVADAQTRNNLQQGIANYQISVNAGTITPSQLAEMHQLQAQLAAA